MGIQTECDLYQTELAQKEGLVRQLQASNQAMLEQQLDHMEEQNSLQARVKQL